MKKFLFLCFLLSCIFPLTAFNLDNAVVPQNEILSGGPPKDGIPALLNPIFIGPSEADFLKPDDRIIGVKLGAEAKAYAIKVLNWHEVVNDTINGIPIVVTF